MRPFPSSFFEFASAVADAAAVAAPAGPAGDRVGLARAVVRGEFPHGGAGGAAVLNALAAVWKGLPARPDPETATASVREAVLRLVEAATDPRWQPGGLGPAEAARVADAAAAWWRSPP